MQRSLWMVSACALIAGGNGWGRAGELSVEQVARIYRIQVYATFRSDREEFDRRRAAGDELLTRWKDSGSREQEPQVVRWFQDATFASQAERVEPLPSRPQWTPVTAPDPTPSPAVPASAAKKPAAPAKSANPEETGSMELIRSVGKALLRGLDGK